MKKVLFFLATMLMLASCENYYIDKHLGGDFHPTDVRTIAYTLTDADYKTIVGYDVNKQLAKEACTETDSSAYVAFLQIAENLAFSNLATAEVYVPALLTNKFPQLSAGSICNVTYNYNTGEEGAENTTPTTTFSLSDVWGSTIYYKQAIAGDGTQGKLVIQDVYKDPALSYVWQYTNNYGMKATAYVSQNYESESWVITPAIELTRAKRPQLSFDQARKYGVEFIEECFIMVSTDYDGDVTTCNWEHIPFNQDEDGKYIVPDGSSWTFMNTGEMDLTKYAGQTIHIGFKYTSSPAGSATWEFKNLLVCEPAN